MKKNIAIIFVIMIIISMFCVCYMTIQVPTDNEKKEYTSDGPATTVNDSFWGNYCNYSWACETDNYIYIGLNGNYRIDKETKKAEYICTDDLCHHTKKCLSSGVMCYVQSSGERVFGLLKTTVKDFADTPNFVELKPHGLCDNVDGRIFKKWDYAVYAIINDNVYVFEKNKKATYLKIMDINKRHELKRVKVDFGDDSTYMCRFISEGYMYCTNDLNDLKKVNLDTGEVKPVLKDVCNLQPAGKSIYFSKSHNGGERSGLYRSDMNGNNITEIAADCESYNIYNGTIYCTTYAYPKNLCSMDLSGNNMKTILKGNRKLSNITILPKSRRILFTDDNSDEASGRQIYCCDFDGSGVEKLDVPDQSE